MKTALTSINSVDGMKVLSMSSWHLLHGLSGKILCRYKGRIYTYKGCKKIVSHQTVFLSTVKFNFLWFPLKRSFIFFSKVAD